MNFRAVSLLAAAIGLGAMPMSFAADMPTKAPLASVSAYNWTGFYAGINGGYGNGNPNGQILPTFFLGNAVIEGGLIGGQVGYNYQMSRWVLGIEADWDWTDINGNPNFFGILSQTTKVKSLGSLRGRVGYAWDRFLVYGTGGWAWGTVESGATGLTTESNTLNGYALGGGVEYGLMPNVSVKAEYLYTHLDPKNYFIAQGCPGPCDMGANVHTFRLGANWRFGGMSAGTPAPTLVAAGPYNWTGFYAGINGGYGSGASTGAFLPTFLLGNFKVNGGLVGGQIGYNYQIAHWVLGIEADWDAADISGDNSFFGVSIDNVKVKSLGSIRGRAGYAWDRFLIYGTGGWAWGTVETSSVILPPESHTLYGYALGGGLEYGVTQNLSVKGEYLYTHLDAMNYYVALGCPGNCDIGANVSTFRLGANWRFGSM